MSNCLFCDDFVGEVNGDGGTKGFTIGTRDVCKSCLQELKYRLEQVIARSPIDREKNEDDIKEKEKNAGEVNIDEESDGDPFSAKAVRQFSRHLFFRHRSWNFCGTLHRAADRCADGDIGNEGGSLVCVGSVLGDVAGFWNSLFGVRYVFRSFKAFT